LPLLIFASLIIAFIKKRKKTKLWYFLYQHQFSKGVRVLWNPYFFVCYTGATF
jgi:hypothetical protein